MFADTFSELQAQLEKEQEEVALADPITNAADEKDLERIVRDLAKKQGFEIQSILGVGGMGAVVKATDLKLKRTVALKFLSPEVISDPENATNLRREAEMASRIQNENVVHILSWHEVDNIPFFAMELVEGEALDQIVKRRKSLPVVEALRITAEAANGLQALHEAGIIHRDIKPQNILIARDGRVKITDFGISRTQDMISEESVKKSSIAGTPKFMSPEQARGEAATKHSDLYSLGATLYYMLTGKAPVLASKDIRKQISNVREGKVISITDHLPKLNKEVAKLVMKCLSAKQAKRPWDIATFKQELDRAYLSYTVRSQAGLFTVIKKQKKTIIPIMALCVGVALGLYAGRELANRKYQASQVSSEHLRALATMQEARLNEILKHYPDATAIANLLGRLQNARAQDSAELLSQVIPATDRQIWRWEVMQTLQDSSSHPEDALHTDAIRIMSQVANSRSTSTTDELLREWRDLWLAENARALNSYQNQGTVQEQPSWGYEPQEMK